MEDRPYNQYGQFLYTEGRWNQLCACSLETSRSGGSLQATSRHLGTKWATVRKTPIRVIKLAVRKLLVCSRVFLSHQASHTSSLRAQSPPPSNLDSFMRWVALATLLLVVRVFSFVFEMTACSLPQLFGPSNEQKRSDCRLQRQCRLTKTDMRSVLIW